MKQYEEMTAQEREDAGLEFTGSANAASASEALSLCGGDVAIPTKSHPYVWLCYRKWEYGGTESEDG